jgi:hypothetical protein
MLQQVKCLVCLTCPDECGVLLQQIEQRACNNTEVLYKFSAITRKPEETAYFLDIGGCRLVSHLVDFVRV